MKNLKTACNFQIWWDESNITNPANSLMYWNTFTRADLFENILTATAIKYQDLSDSLCQTIANMIKGRSPEEVRWPSSQLLLILLDSQAVQYQERLYTRGRRESDKREWMVYRTLVKLWIRNLGFYWTVVFKTRKFEAWGWSPSFTASPPLSPCHRPSSPPYHSSIR